MGGGRRRRCGECRAQFPAAQERCPACGTTWKPSSRHRLVVLAVVVVLLALLYWVIVRYLVPPHEPVGLGPAPAASAPSVTPRW